VYQHISIYICKYNICVLHLKSTFITTWRAQRLLFFLHAHTHLHLHTCPHTYASSYFHTHTHTHWYTLMYTHIRTYLSYAHASTHSTYLARLELTSNYYTLTYIHIYTYLQTTTLSPTYASPPTTCKHIHTYISFEHTHLHMHLVWTHTCTYLSHLNI